MTINRAKHKKNDDYEVFSALYFPTQDQLHFSLGNYFELSASVSPIRIEVSNLRGGVTSTLALNGVTSSTIVWSSNVLQPSGSAYTASVSGSNDILSFVAFNSGKVNVVSTLKMI